MVKKYYRGLLTVAMVCGFIAILTIITMVLGLYDLLFVDIMPWSFGDIWNYTFPIGFVSMGIAGIINMYVYEEVFMNEDEDL